MARDTISLVDACQDVWDIVVVGAGLSGTIAAREAARLGSRVLLVEKATFPRRKVCGCFLNANALASLTQLDLSHLIVAAQAPSVRGVYISAGRRQAYLPLPTGAALSRHWLDAELAGEAIAAGVSMLLGTVAHLVGRDEDHCRLRLICGEQIVEICARIVIAADGLSGGLARETQGCTRTIQPHSRIGVSAATTFVPRGYKPGTIQMSVGSDGYIGSLQVEDGHLEIAASLDPATIRRFGLGETVQRILQQSPLPRFEGVAARYIEPFTGEGMAWAIASGAAIAPIAHQASFDYSHELPRRWIAERARLLRGRMRLCRLVTHSLRNQSLTELNISVLGHLPFLAQPFICWLNRPHTLPSAPQ